MSIPLQPPSSNAAADPTWVLSPKEKEMFSEITSTNKDYTVDMFLKDRNTMQFALENLGKDWNTMLQVLQANNPSPPPGDANAFSNLSNLTKGNAVKMAAAAINAGGTNDWFAPNAAVAFTIAFQNFMKALSQIQLLEGTVIGPKMTEMSWALAKDLGEQIMTSAKLQASMEVSSAIANGLMGAISLASAALSTAKWAKMNKNSAGSTGSFDSSKLTEADWKQISAYTQNVSMFADAAKGFTNMGKDLDVAGKTVQKGASDAAIELLRTLMNQTNRRSELSDKTAAEAQEQFKNAIRALTELLQQQAQQRAMKI